MSAPLRTGTARTSNDESLSPAAALLLAVFRPEAEHVLRRVAPAPILGRHIRLLRRDAA